MITDIDELAELIAIDIVNGNLSSARTRINHHPDAALLTAQVVYALSYKMGDDVSRALKKVHRLLNY